jgi:hypothetical protein
MNRVLLPVLVGVAGLLGPGVALAQAGDPPPAAPAEAPAPAPAAVDPGEYNRQLLSIEEDVHALKERVFRAKATLQLLKEIVVQGSAAGSRATVWHENKLGRAYQVDSIAYYVDGQSKFAKADPSGSLDQMTEFKVFEGAVPPGEHNLTVSIKLRGTGYGIFSYARSIEMNVQASTAFIAEEGKDCSVRARVDERKGIGRSFVERPRVEFTTSCVRSSDAVGSP